MNGEFSYLQSRRRDAVQCLRMEADAADRLAIVVRRRMEKEHFSDDAIRDATLRLIIRASNFRKAADRLERLVTRSDWAGHDIATGGIG